MAKLPIAMCSQAALPDLWWIRHQWSIFHLVIAFYCQITAIFVKVVFVTPHKFELWKMDLKNEQRSVINFCCWLKISVAETVKLMHGTYTDDEWLGDSTIFCWRKAFSKGRETASLLPHVGQPLSICTEMVNTVTTVVWEDRHNTVWQLAQVLDISISSVYIILCEKLKMCRVAACLGSSFNDLRTERPLYWDLLQVSKKNRRWPKCDGTHNYGWWKLDSSLQSN